MATIRVSRALDVSADGDASAYLLAGMGRCSQLRCEVARPGRDWVEAPHYPTPIARRSAEVAGMEFRSEVAPVTTVHREHRVERRINE
jgi:hypothetical protein